MKKIAVLFLLLFAGCSAHVKKNAAFYYAENIYEEAKALYDQKKYEESSKKLDQIIKMKEEGAPYLGESLYLKAQIYVTLAQDLKNPINFDPILGKFKNPQHEDIYDSLYSLAIYNLTTIVKLLPESELAPKALLMQAVIFDFNHLGFLKDAMQLYSLVATHYPDSKEGKIAIKRLNRLNLIFQQIEKNPHVK